MFTAADVMRAFLPKELPPPFTSAPLADALAFVPLDTKAGQEAQQTRLSLRSQVKNVPQTSLHP